MGSIGDVGVVDPRSSRNGDGLVEPSPLFIDHSQVRGGVRLVVHGEVDVATAGQLEMELRGALGTGGRVELDLAGVGFMDSTGLHALLEPMVASGRRLVLFDASRQVARLFDAAGITGLFDGPEVVIDLRERRIDDARIAPTSAKATTTTAPTGVEA